MDFSQIAKTLVTAPIEMNKVESVEKVEKVKKAKPFLSSYGISTHYEKGDQYILTISRDGQSDKTCNPDKYFSHLIIRIMEVENVKKIDKVIKVINLVNEPEMKTVEKLFEVFNLAMVAEVKINEYMEKAISENVNAYEKVDNLEEVENLVGEVINLKNVNVLNKYAIAAIMENL